MIRSQAVFIAIGVNWEGRRQILGVDLAGRESRSTWGEFLSGLRERGLHGVEYVVSDNHEGLQEGRPRGASPGGLAALPRALPAQRARPRADLAAWLARWQATHALLTNWVEHNIEETWTFCSLPEPHHKHLKSTNVLERLNEEIRRRTRVVRILPNRDSCLRLIRALAVERHEDGLEGSRYLNMSFLAELKKEQLREAA